MDHYISLIKNLSPVSKTLIGLALLIPLIFGIFSWPFFIFIGLPIALKVYITIFTSVKTPSTARIDGKVAIITGGNSGLGYATAKELAKRGGNVILACRSIERGNLAADKIKKELGNNAIVSAMKLDLASMKSVREFVQKFLSEQTRLDILVNNAGGYPPALEKVLTEDKLESTFAGNHFGPFLLTNLLLDLMRKTGKARIVNVSSLGHSFCRSLDIDDLNCEKSGLKSTEFFDLTYARTKLANVLFTRELDRRFRAWKVTEITVNVLHPGGIKTEILRASDDQVWYKAVINEIMQMFFKTAEIGAQTQIHLSVAEEVEELSGLYWDNCVETGISKLAQDTKLAKALWEKSASLVKLSPQETIV